MGHENEVVIVDDEEEEEEKEEQEQEQEGCDSIKTTAASAAASASVTKKKRGRGRKKKAPSAEEVSANVAVMQKRKRKRKQKHQSLLTAAAADEEEGLEEQGTMNGLACPTHNKQNPLSLFGMGLLHRLEEQAKQRKKRIVLGGSPNNNNNHAAPGEGAQKIRRKYCNEQAAAAPSHPYALDDRNIYNFKETQATSCFPRQSAQEACQVISMFGFILLGVLVMLAWSQACQVPWMVCFIFWLFW